MKCRVRECATECGLTKYEWWLRVETEFTAMMLGRYLNDGLGAAPPSAEETLRSLKVLSWVTRYRRLDEVTALVEMIDRARRKREAGTGNEAGR